MSEHIVKFAFDGVDVTLLSSDTITSDDLPAGTYTFASSQFRGVWLTKCPHVPAVTGKVYGKTGARVAKTMDAFRRRTGNTGVLLSGEPGMGKSLFIKLLAAEARRAGMPVIVIRNDYGTAMVDILSKIHTECLVIMDEFEKIFTKCGDDDDDGEKNAQNKLLSLMDGVTDNKKLFVASVNDEWRVSRFMINRPGRFYYKFNFTYLDADEIREYLVDQLVDKDKVSGIAAALMGHKVNYDGLAAIVEEINSGKDQDETLDDLNIDHGSERKYDVRLVIDGTVWTAKEIRVDMGDTGNVRFYLYGKYKDDDRADLLVKFDIDDLCVSRNADMVDVLSVPGDCLTLSDLPYEGDEEMKPKDIGDLELIPHAVLHGYRRLSYRMDV